MTGCIEDLACTTHICYIHMTRSLIVSLSQIAVYTSDYYEGWRIARRTCGEGEANEEPNKLRNYLIIPIGVIFSDQSDVYLIPSTHCGCHIEAI